MSSSRRTPSPGTRPYMGDSSKSNSLSGRRRCPSPKNKIKPIAGPTIPSSVGQRVRGKTQTPSQAIPTSMNPRAGTLAGREGSNDDVDVDFQNLNLSFLSQSVDDNTMAGNNAAVVSNSWGLRHSLELKQMVTTQKEQMDIQPDFASESSDLTQETEREPYMVGDRGARSHTSQSSTCATGESEVTLRVDEDMKKQLAGVLQRAEAMIKEDFDSKKILHFIEESTKSIKMMGGRNGSHVSRRCKSGSEAMMKSHLPQECMRLHVDYDDPELTKLPNPEQDDNGSVRGDGALAPTKKLFLSNHENVDAMRGSLSPPSFDRKATVREAVPPLKLDCLDGNNMLGADMVGDPASASLVRYPSDQSGRSNGSSKFVLSPRTAFDDVSVSSANSVDTGSVSGKLY